MILTWSFILSHLMSTVSPSYFLNEFAVYVPAGSEVADRLAAKHGFHNTGQIGDLEDYFLFQHRRLSKRSATESALHQILLTQEPDVKWFEQQKELKRVKRDYQSVKKRDFAGEASEIWADIFEELSEELAYFFNGEFF